MRKECLNEIVNSVFIRLEILSLSVAQNLLDDGTVVCWVAEIESRKFVVSHEHDNDSNDGQYGDKYSHRDNASSMLIKEGNETSNKGNSSNLIEDSSMLHVDSLDCLFDGNSSLLNSSNLLEIARSLVQVTSQSGEFIEVKGARSINIIHSHQSSNALIIALVACISKRNLKLLEADVPTLVCVNSVKRGSRNIPVN